MDNRLPSDLFAPLNTAEMSDLVAGLFDDECVATHDGQHEDDCDDDNEAVFANESQGTDRVHNMRDR